MTPNDRYRANLAALHLLPELHLGQALTSDEQATLRLYEGWADGRVRAFGYDSAGTAKPELLSALAPLGVKPESLVNAGGLSAYFTPPAVAAAVWKMGLSALGRNPRMVLEPSAGNGRFIAALLALHDTLDEPHRTFIAIEPDPIYSRILSHLYSEPQGPWKVRATTLEKAGLVEPTFDLIVGNAPFGDWGVSDSNCPASLRHRHLQSKVHDYFLCKAVSLLLPGGVCAMITHRSTLDRESVGVREWLAARADLVGAWRLPAELWGDQGAAPVADVLVLRRNGARV